MSLRKENIVPIADMLYTSLKRDLSEFEKANKTFNQAYLDAFAEAIKNARAQESSDYVLINQKKLTVSLYGVGDALIKPLQLLSFVFENSTVASTLPSETILAIKKRNFESVLAKLGALQKIVADNTKELTKAGMQDNVLEMLQKALVDITEANQIQNDIKQERKLVTQTEKSVHQELLDNYIKKITKLGKIIFSDDIRADEYTQVKIVSKITNASTKTKPAVDGNMMGNL